MHFDSMVHNAGSAVVKPFENVALDEWHATFAVNVTAPILLTQKLASRMLAGPNIVHILSIAAQDRFSNWSAYCTSKFALEGLSQSLREELRPCGIRVLNIYPGATATDIWNAAEGDWPRHKMMSAGEVAEAAGFALSRPADVRLNISPSRTLVVHCRTCQDEGGSAVTEIRLVAPTKPWKAPQPIITAAKSGRRPQHSGANHC